MTVCYYIYMTIIGSEISPTSTEGADAIEEGRTDVYTPVDLLRASLVGNSDAVRSILGSGVPANVHVRGLLPLVAASMMGHLETVETLLELGAEVGVYDRHRRLPLVVASGEGHSAVVETLLEHGANIYSESTHHRCALIRAAIEGHSETVKALLDHETEVDQEQHSYTDHEYCLPLTVAILHGHTTVAKLLLVKPPSLFGIGSHHLLVACFVGHVEIASLLLEHGVSVDEGFVSPLMAASFAGYAEVVKLLICHDASVNSTGIKGMSALFLASLTDTIPTIKTSVVEALFIDYMLKKIERSKLVQTSIKGHTAVTKLLLEHGAEVNSGTNYGFSPLDGACFTGHTETVQLLVDHGAKVNVEDGNNYSSLMIASLAGHTDVVELLLQHGAEVNIQNQLGALHFASATGQTNTVKFLLDSGAKVNAQDGAGTCALHLASKAGHDETVKLLIEQDAEIDLQNEDGSSSLIMACSICPEKVVLFNTDLWNNMSSSLTCTNRNGLLKTIQVLLHHGAQVNMLNNDGYSALCKACIVGQPEIVKVLLSNDAQLNNRNGPPLQIASLMGHTETVRLLLDGGADVNEVVDEENALTLASGAGHSKVLKLLLDHDANVNALCHDGLSVLMMAILGSALFVGEIKSDQVEDTAKEATAKEANSECVVIEDETTENCDVKEDSGHDGVEQKYTKKENRADSEPGTKENGTDSCGSEFSDNSDDERVFFVEGNTEIRIEAVKLLLNHRCDVDARTKCGLSALMMASFTGQAEIVKLLLDHGGHVNAVDVAGESALIVASATGCTDIFPIRLLLNTSEQTSGIRALLHAKVDKAGCLKVVELLIDHGAEVNARDHFGVSALIAASLAGNEDVLKVLVKRGSHVDPNAMLCARQKGHARAVKFLKRSMGSLPSCRRERTTPTEAGTERICDQSKPTSEAGLDQLKMFLFERFNKIEKKQDKTLEMCKNFTVVAKTPGTHSAPRETPKKPTVPDAFEDLLPLAEDWHNIGTLLRVDSCQLNAIKADNSKVRDCLRVMLEEWLKLLHPSPSWEQLAKAVASLKYQSKAEDIRIKYMHALHMK